MAGDDEPKDDNRRTLGEALGGWARKVGELVAEVSGQAPPVPDALREPLEASRALRLEGATQPATDVLRGLGEPLASHPLARWAIALAAIYDLLRGGRPLRTLEDATAGIGDALGPGPIQLLRGAHDLFSDKPEPALDDLRRAGRDSGRLADAAATEHRFLVRLLAAHAHLRLGHEDRALRELRKAQAAMPVELGAWLRREILRRGVELLLAADEIAEAEAWAREAVRRDEGDRNARELLARAIAAKGDRVGAQAILERLGDDESLDATRLWVGLAVGDDGDGLRKLALRHLQQAPDDPMRRRWWALAELAHARGRDGAPDARLAGEILDALARAIEIAPPATRDRWLEELGHAALRLDALPDSVRAPVMARLRTDDGTAPEELRLLRARERIAGRTDDMAADFLGTPPRFRADPDVGGPWGPDPTSPVRDPDRRTAVLASQRSLIAAEYALATGDTEAAQDLLVEALIEQPGLHRAARLLGELVHPLAGTRLEDLLASATALLAAVPNRVLGVPLDGVAQALAQVVAARERLARPLTIAIMGEFSSGKSTFVNALLGEAVAPMGVLPTTTTINVFRRGPGGGARVHYRDGHIETLAKDEVQRFLHGLDTIAAARIRHVEIERVGARMGDAAVVDTPGLNALDPFHEQVARELLDEADAVVWVFSATRSGAATEVGMLAGLRASGRNVLGVLNKVDTLEPAEQQELASYLRAQLGEVLVDVVPLRAREALEHRTGDGSGDDPFGEVERALEQHFLQHARELKRSLTARRLGEALASARDATVTAADALDARADAAAQARHDRPTAHALLVGFGDAVHTGVLDLDDLLVRESLATGVVQAGRVGKRGAMDAQDAAYLAAAFLDGAHAALRRALAEIARVDAAASEVLDRSFVPWARGNLEGALAADLLPKIVREHGDRITGGEAAVRAAFRTALVPMADAWAAHARTLAGAVERARVVNERRAASAPRAEALRLRATTLSAVDALRLRLTEVAK